MKFALLQLLPVRVIRRQRAHKDGRGYRLTALPVSPPCTALRAVLAFIAAPLEAEPHWTLANA
jgi:hypothetical protein